VSLGNFMKEGLRRVLETCGSPSPDPYNLRSMN
jgi:hypothetical protein